MTKSTLVTIFGGSGFLGRYTVRALANSGYRIRVAVRYPNLANYLLPMGHVGQIQITKTDITDPADVADAVRGAQAVVNMVGVLYGRGRQTFKAVHTDAARSIAQAAKAAGASRFVQISAIGADPQSQSAYGRTKAEGEAAVLAQFPQATILRPSLLIGVEDAFFNRFAAMARLSPVLPLIGGGHTRFQPAVVGDVATAVQECLRRDDACGQTYELGGPKIYTFRELMALMLHEIGRRRVLLPIPFGLATLQSWFLQFLPKPPLTPDQVAQLKTDNVVATDAAGFADLGIVPNAIEAVLPLYLWRFRREGQFSPGAPERFNVSSAPQ